MNKHKNIIHLNNVIENFNVEGYPCGVISFGNGHINNTYIVNTFGEKGLKRYILQQINNSIFKNPERLMENIYKVTEFLKEKSGNENESLSFLTTKSGDLCYKDCDGGYWRMYKFVDNADGVDRPTTEEFYQSAVAFGRFQRFLSDFPAETLYETIPDFHNTPKRYRDFTASVDENKSGRKDTALEEIAFVNERQNFYSTLIDANKEGILPLRVSHNDTKSNNVLLSNETHKAICVIDLDTVMPGFSVTDFGDSIRFGASTADEDEKDLSKVKLDIDKFRVYTKGFIEGCGGQLPEEEIMLFPEGAKMMTIECGMRFLADYLDGDTYFRTAYPEHNLVRCRTQFKLVAEMEEHWDELKAIVQKYIKNS